jgi:site-specific DNA-methyltransferase (adenine-specific)
MELLTGDFDFSSRPFSVYRQGDCVELAREFLPDGAVDLIITDPPYGIQGDELHRHYNRKEEFVIEGYTEVPAERYYDFSRAWIEQAQRVLRPGGSFFLISGWTHLRHILNALEETRLELINHLIWKYNFGVFTKYKFVTSHYHILFLAKPGGERVFNTHARYGSRQKSLSGGSMLYEDMEDVWKIDRVYKSGKVRNKNELPPALVAKMIQYASRPGDVVADFFAGSFSTLKVAKALGRNGIGFEIGEQACEYQRERVAEIGWGEGIVDLPEGEDDRPLNQNRKWSAEELEALRRAFLALKDEGKSKAAAMVVLQEEFERGRFSILNALKRQGL